MGYVGSIYIENNGYMPQIPVEPEAKFYVVPPL